VKDPRVSLLSSGRRKGRIIAKNLGKKKKKIIQKKSWVGVFKEVLPGEPVSSKLHKFTSDSLPGLSVRF